MTAIVIIPTHPRYSSLFRGRFAPGVFAGVNFLDGGGISSRHVETACVESVATAVRSLKTI